MEIIIFWLVLAILVGVFAGSKGRSGFGYFLLAILLSPLIGFIIVLILSPVLKNTEAKSIASGNLKKCPECAELVKAEAKICKHCKSTLIVKPQPNKSKNDSAADGIDW